MRCLPYSLIAVLLLCGGCSNLDTRYASYRGTSINGVRVFAELLREDGYEVDVWPTLGDNLYEGYDTIIVFHHGFGPPSEEAGTAIRDHEYYGDATTLVYIGRDMDVTARYWEAVAEVHKTAGRTEQAAKAGKQAQSELADLKQELRSTYSVESDAWLPGVKVDRDAVEELTSIEVIEVVEANESADQTPPQSVQRPLDGKTSDSTVPPNEQIPCQWPIFRRLLPPENARVVWQTAGGEPLLIQVPNENLDIFAMHSAYPFLNGGLIDGSNRALVQRFADEIYPLGRIAIVTSSRSTGGEDDQSQMWRLLTVFPHQWIAAHLLLFCLLFCLWKLPIFGRPRVEEYQDLKRFGAHIEALGALFRQSGQRDFATKRIRTWLSRQSAGQRSKAIK